MNNNHEVEIESVEFRSADIGLATALAISGFEVIHIEHGEEIEPIFIFQLDENLMDIVKSYLTNKLTISARLFAEKIKVLETRGDITL
jgi:hypothetical protein